MLTAACLIWKYISSLHQLQGWDHETCSTYLCSNYLLLKLRIGQMAILSSTPWQRHKGLRFRKIIYITKIVWLWLSTIKIAVYKILKSNSCDKIKRFPTKRNLDNHTYEYNICITLLILAYLMPYIITCMEATKTGLGLCHYYIFVCRGNGALRLIHRIIWHWYWKTPCWTHDKMWSILTAKFSVIFAMNHIWW